MILIIDYQKIIVMIEWGWILLQLEQRTMDPLVTLFLALRCDSVIDQNT